MNELKEREAYFVENFDKLYSTKPRTIKQLIYETRPGSTMKAVYPMEGGKWFVSCGTTAPDKDRLKLWTADGVLMNEVTITESAGPQVLELLRDKRTLLQGLDGEEFDILTLKDSDRSIGQIADVILVLRYTEKELVLFGSNDGVLVYNVDEKVSERFQLLRDGVACMCELSEGLILIGTQQTVELWDLRTKTCVTHFSCLKKYINTPTWMVALDDGLIACSWNMKPWKRREGITLLRHTTTSGRQQSLEYKSNLIGHDAVVTQMIKLKTGLMASASLDRTFRIWCYTSGTCQFVIQSNQRLNSLCELTDGRIVTACDNGDIEIWKYQFSLSDLCVMVVAQAMASGDADQLESFLLKTLPEELFLKCTNCSKLIQLQRLEMLLLNRIHPFISKFTVAPRYPLWDQ